MIKKLRRKFILSTMSILVALFAVVLGTINYSYARMGIRQSEAFLQSVAQAEAIPHNRPGKNSSGSWAQRLLQESGALPPPTAPHPDGQDPGVDLGGFDSLGQLYLVKLDTTGEITQIQSLTETSTASEQEITNAAQSALAKKQTLGKIDNYRYCVAEKPYGKILVLMDKTNSYESLARSRLLTASFTVGSAGLVLLFFVSLWLSRFVTKPAEETFNKQKKFISDASHELKTPLSVIALNADVLSAEIGPNKYMDYIRSETKRMDGLIHQLLELSRMEDASRPLHKIHFSLSQALFEILLPFESTAFEREIDYHIEVQENCFYSGEPESIKQLAAILLDNAFKNTPDCGKISAILSCRGGSPVLTVSNTGAGIAPQDLPHIFERFYRCDKSRSEQNGSYGLGLAIAKSIVNAHSGSIKAESTPGGITTFTVQL